MKKAIAEALKAQAAQAQADRLAALEAKVDRILELLEPAPDAKPKGKAKADQVN